MKNPLNSAFSGWKIALAIAIGLLISGWMLYRNISKVQFIETENGTHTWVDVNNNGKVDVDNPDEFQPAENGTYKEQTITDLLSTIQWSATTWIWLGAAILFMIGRDFFYMLRIRLLTENKLTWKAAFYVIMIWEFASALSPGVVGGSAVAMFILNRETIPFGKATAIVIITAFMDNLFYVVMIPLVFLFIHHTSLFPAETGGDIALIWWFWTGFAIILGICLLLYLTIFWYPKLAQRVLLFIFRFPLIKRWKFIALEWGKDIEQASRQFKQAPRVYWFKVFFATFGSWISRYLVLNALLNAFLSLGFYENIQALGKQLVLWLFMLVSVTPGGSGVAEYGFGELFASFTSSGLLLTGIALLWRLISYFPYLFAGSIVLPKWIQRTRR